MGKKLTTSEAVIHTAGIEVQTLTIKGRQLTLAVFRQLPEEPILEPRRFIASWQYDLSTIERFKGDVWGHVNYFWGPADKYTGEKLHVVWQSGDELRRSVLVKNTTTIDAEEPYQNILCVTRCRVATFIYQAIEDRKNLRQIRGGWCLGSDIADDALVAQPSLYLVWDTPPRCITQDAIDDFERSQLGPHHSSHLLQIIKACASDRDDAELLCRVRKYMEDSDFYAASAKEAFQGQLDLHRERTAAEASRKHARDKYAALYGQAKKSPQLFIAC